MESKNDVKTADNFESTVKRFVRNPICEYCGKPGKEIEIDIPVQPKGGGYGASFNTPGEDTDKVVLCAECVDDVLEYCEECGILARSSDIASYGH